MAEENHRYSVNIWKSLVFAVGQLGSGRVLLVRSKFHRQEERTDGPVATTQAQESGTSDFQSLISLLRIPSRFEIETCKHCSELER